MDVSIIVPFLDAAATLPACLAGLQAQDDFDGDVEWIFVDNGSTDDSAKILRADTRVRLLLESRPGAYMARNTGAAAATGGILAFIDPDCVPGQSWLRSLFDAMREPGVAVALGVWARRIERPLLGAAIGLIMGGALGNVIDRIRFGYVVDFLDISGVHVFIGSMKINFPWVFNIADSAICIGVVLLILDSVRAEQEAKVGLAAEKS
jgi:glycosyltransferase involved in cell wall biosynthesis